MSAHLQRITAKAKQIRKSHPKIKWTDAIKQASKSLKGSAPKKAVHKKTARKAAVKKSPSKKVSMPRVHTVKRKTHRVAGTIQGHTRAACALLENQYGVLATKKLLAKKKTDKRKLQKKMSEVSRKIKMYK